MGGGSARVVYHRPSNKSVRLTPNPPLLVLHDNTTHNSTFTGGINLVTYYATTVFEMSLGFSPTLSRFMTGWLGTEYFLAAVLALFVVDRLGRRKLMMWGAAGMAVSLLVIGASLSYAAPQNKGPAYAATVFIFVYDTFFALGWLGVTWVRFINHLLVWFGGM